MDVFALTMRLKEEGAAQVKASVDKLKTSLDQTTASAQKLDTGATTLREAQRKWASETRGLASSMASGNMSLSDASKRYDDMIATMAVANQKGIEQKAVVEKATGAMAGQNSQVRSLRDTLVTLASETLGANAAGVRLTSTLGSMVAGQALIVGVLAGVAAISAAYDALTADTRKLTEEQDKAVEALNRVARAQQFGVGGELVSQIDIANKKLKTLKDELKAAQKQSITPIVGGDIGTLPNQNAAEVAAAKERVRVLKEQIAAGERELLNEVNDANARYSMERSEQLRSLVEANRATLAEQEEYARRRVNIEQQLADKTLSAAKRLQMIEQLRTLTPKEKKPKAEKKPLKLAEVSDIGSAFAQLRGRIPLQEITIPVMPKIELPPEMEGGKAGVFAKVGADFVNGWAEMMDSVGDQLSNILVDSVASAFENLAATGGSLKSAFKVLTSGLLSGLGGMLIEFGRYVIVAGNLMARVKESLASMNPVAGIAAGLAMIAIGGMLRGAASRSFSTPSGGGGGGGGYSAGMPTGSMAFATQYYGPTAAGSANTIERINPVSVTIIGPNDPAAQRQMQELIRNANRRGSV